MVIDNTSHTKRCSPRCENFNGFQSHCCHRVPIKESRHDYLYRMHKMRSDTQFHRTVIKEDGEVKHTLIQGSCSSVCYGRCSKDEIVTRSERIKPVRKRVSVGGVL